MTELNSPQEFADEVIARIWLDLAVPIPAIENTRQPVFSGAKSQRLIVRAAFDKWVAAYL